MTDKELKQLGVPSGAPLEAARRGIQEAVQAGLPRKSMRKLVRQVLRNPAAQAQHPHFGGLAQLLMTHAIPAHVVRMAPPSPPLREGMAPWQQWGAGLDPESVQQMRNACSLPVSVRGALMPDAHVGYGLPIGGVLAVHNAVIPFAVGVDIACRMKMTVLDLPPDAVTGQMERLRHAIETETRFGVGSSFRDRRAHEVMDRNWSVSPVTREHKDKAWAQLGTSGSGNHFVEFGRLEIFAPGLDLPPGEYLALLSHSGSRGTGALVCDHYSKIAMKRLPELPRELQRLAWLSLDSDAGQEYWAAMELMGRYAAANHACIHRYIAQHLGARVLLDLENHHNFAWKEVHDGQTVIVHRKGATPAAQGVLGIIPGSMASPAYIVRGKGNPASMNSAAHGAGRLMSRTQAKKTFTWKQARAVLDAQGVTLMTAGLEEVPMVYKNIHEVMAAQRDLVTILGQFDPKLVKMAPHGERAED